MDAFDDGWKPPVKPTAPLMPAGKEETEERILLERGHYDSYIATVDDDFGRLFDFMEREGILDNNYVVLTSDHGDIYERGVIGHMNEYLYEPLVRIPLVISSPGQASQVDIHAPTSSIDVLPTLLALTGRSVPDACEGVLLPGLGGKEDAQRSIFSIDTKTTHVKGQIRNATISVRKGQYKLIAYLGYEGFEDSFELYDLQSDPEELLDLSTTKPETFSELRREVDEKLSEVNEPYE
jgi:arylsulfatase A-like enzyme